MQWVEKIRYGISFYKDIKRNDIHINTVHVLS